MDKYNAAILNLMLKNKLKLLKNIDESIVEDYIKVANLITTEAEKETFYDILFQAIDLTSSENKDVLLKIANSIEFINNEVFKLIILYRNGDSASIEYINKDDLLEELKKERTFDNNRIQYYYYQALTMAAIASNDEEIISIISNILEKNMGE